SSRTCRGWLGTYAASCRRAAWPPALSARAPGPKAWAGLAWVVCARAAVWATSPRTGTTTAASRCSSCCAGPISSPTPPPAAGNSPTPTWACTAPPTSTRRRPSTPGEKLMAADVAAERPRSTLTLGLEDRPALPQAVVMGFQHVLVSNVWLDPVFVAAVGGLSAGLAGNLINAIFLAAGLVTLTQSTRLVRLPIVEGPSAAFDGLMIGFAKGGQLAMATTGLLIGGVILFVVAASG